MSKSEFKTRLTRYINLLAEIKIEERRAEAFPPVEKTESITQRRARASIQDTLGQLLEQENQEYEALVKIINALPQVEQRQVLLARYMDGQSWPKIAQVIFGTRKDFQEKIQSYERRTYRIHGNALANANKILLSQRRK